MIKSTRTRYSRGGPKMAEPNIPAGFDPTDPDLCHAGLPVAELAGVRKGAPILGGGRRVAPIWWGKRPPGAAGFGDGGYGAVTKPPEIREAPRNEVFSSRENT